MTAKLECLTIKQTSDYKIFKYIKGNRIPKEKDINELMEQIRKSKIVEPICVNEKLEILDGQHRVEVCKRLLLPVNYYILKGGTLDTVHAMNTVRKNWTNTTFAESYASLGKQSYQIYTNFKEQYGFSHDIALLLLRGKNTGGGNAGNTARREFKEGMFSIDSAKRATDIAEKLIQLAPYYNGYKRRNFVYAMMNCMNIPKFEFKEFIKKVAYQQRKMVHCVSVDMYMEMIAEIYNYQRRKEDKLNFKSN